MPKYSMPTSDWVLLGVLFSAGLAGLVAIGLGAAGHAEQRPDSLRLAHFTLSGALLASCVAFAWHRRWGRNGVVTVGGYHVAISGALGVITAVLAFVAPGVLGVVFALVSVFVS